MVGWIIINTQEFLGRLVTQSPMCVIDNRNHKRLFTRKDSFDHILVQRKSNRNPSGSKSTQWMTPIAEKAVKP